MPVYGFQFYFQFPVYGLGCPVVVIFFQVNPFKMHGREDCVNLLHPGPGYEIDAPYIFVFMAGIEPGVHAVIDVLFEFVIIFFRDPAETDLDKTVVYQFIHIFRQIQEGGDTV